MLRIGFIFSFTCKSKFPPEKSSISWWIIEQKAFSACSQFQELQLESFDRPAELLLFPSASLLPSSQPCCLHLFLLPPSVLCGRRWNFCLCVCVCVLCCFLKCFCLYHHIIQVGLRNGHSSTGFAHPECVLMDVLSTGELRGKKAQQGDFPCHVTRFQWCRPSLLIY